MADPLRSALDRMELCELMNRYASSIDLRDWTRLRSVFADGEIEADFTSMGVKQIFRGPAEAWVDLVRQTITGFDATQHFFANHSAEVDGDRAVDTRYMQARHQLGDAPYTIGGYYTGQMLRPAAGWRAAAHGHRVPEGDGARVAAVLGEPAHRGPPSRRGPGTRVAREEGSRWPRSPWHRRLDGARSGVSSPTARGATRTDLRWRRPEAPAPTAS